MIKFSKTDKNYGCFSNFHKCPVNYKGLTYKSSEAAWQAQKVQNESDKEQFTELNPGDAKKLGRKVELRPDWEDVKYDLMVDVCLKKFAQNPMLATTLLSTGDEELVEDTTGWHDNTWGNCDCPKCAGIKGKNLLGKALMDVRKILR